MVTNNGKRDLTLKELTDYIKAQLKHGIGVEHAMQELLQRGWPEVSARQFVLHAAQSITFETGSTVAEVEERLVEARAGKKRLACGLVMVLVALGLAVLGLYLTGTGTGFLFFAVGTVLGAFAIVFVLTGLNCWFSNRN